jgi:hypothetical protein
MQQFYININYNTCISNHFTDYLNRPPMATLTTVLQSCGNEALEWPQLYQQDPEFTTTYQLLGISTTITDFHIQDKLSCHMGHLFVPIREHAKLIWEAHYSRVEDHFGVEKTVVVLQKHFIGQNFDRTSTSIYDLVLPVPLPSQPSRRKAYTPLFLFLKRCGNSSQWMTCLVFHPPSMKMTTCLWSLIDF